MTTLEETVAAQRTASDPRRSAFVAANAGAGKTSVLTNRVARLLLAGVAPERILCITFTKAAAAEMASRLFDMLGKWSLLDDAPLSVELDRIDGGAPRDFNAARRLFARALDTPGGLKIQTIHAFCDHVLKRFPLEAGVAPVYAVLTEAEAKALVEDAFDAVAIADRGPLARLLSSRGGDDVRKLVVGLVVSRQEINRAPKAEVFKAALLVRLGVDAALTEDAARQACLDLVAADDIRRAQRVYRQGMKEAPKLAEGPMADFLAATSPEARLNALKSVLLNQEGEPRKRLGDAQTRALDPSIDEFLKDRAAALVEALDVVKAVQARDDTFALLDAVGAVLARYAAAKSARAALDFDDLIEKTRALLEREDAAWVRYKLDAGVDHILLDEAQDTSP
ncbi:MAG: UvrD-helicase domain-containing protein, partial [Parvularculaceae bacterium]|nr:UvrD-helicase domain-containing protein [Parvularculaceae bacterium]